MSAEIITAPPAVAGEVVAPPFDYDQLGAEARIEVRQAAKEIRDELEAIGRSAIKVGQRLLEVRQRLPHGQWRAWLAAETLLSPDTAESLINQAQLAGQMPKFSAFEDRFDRTAIALLARPSTPDTARDEALARAEAGEQVSYRDAKEIVQASKAAARGGVAAAATPPVGRAQGVGPGRLADWQSRVAAIGGTLTMGQDGYTLVEPGASALALRTMRYHLDGRPDSDANYSDGGATLPERIALLEDRAASDARDARGLARVPYPGVTDPKGWDALRTRVLALGGTLTQAISGMVTLDLGEHRAVARPGSPGWDVLCGLIETAERPTALTLPGVPTPARQPYGAAGSGRWQPAVPHVLIIGDRPGLYEPPAISRAATVYDTAETVRVRRVSGTKEETQAQHKVWAVPDDAAWSEVLVAHAAFEAALVGLAGVLRELGRYDKRLAANGGIKAQPSPLCLSVARAADPDKKNPSTWWLSPWHVPSLTRTPIERHTPKMLASGEIGSYTFAQDGAFVLPDDAAWERASAAHVTVSAAAAAMVGLLERLGTYRDVVARASREAREGTPEQQRAAVGATPAPAQPPPSPAPAADDTPATPPDLPADFAVWQARVEALDATLSWERGTHDWYAVGEADGFRSTFSTWPACQGYIEAMESEAAPAAANEATVDAGDPDTFTDAEREVIEQQQTAAAERIIASWPDPHCRLLARLLCFAEEADDALTAPIAAVRAGFRRVFAQSGSVWSDEDAAAVAGLLRQVAQASALPPRPAPAPRGDHSEIMRELEELRAWADQVEGMTRPCP